MTFLNLNKTGKRLLKLGNPVAGAPTIPMVTTAQHLEKAMVERNQVFEDLQGVISEISFQEGITPGQSISVLVNDLLDRNPLQLNEIVTDSDIDSVLISIRSSANTKFNVEPPLSSDYDGLSDADIFDPVLDDAFSGDLLQTEIPGAIESMRGIMTYKQLQDFAEELMLVQDVQFKETFTQVRPINELVESRANLQERFKNLEEKVIPSIRRNMLPVQKDVYEIISNQGTQADLIRGFQSSLDISMVVSETNLNWNALNTALTDITGSSNLVGLGDQQYQVMLALNAKVHADALNASNRSMQEATTLVEDIRDRVLAMPDRSQQPEALAGEMRKLLEGPDGLKIKTYFPEFEKILSVKRSTGIKSAELAHPGVSRLRDDLTDILVDISMRPETPGLSSTMRRTGDPLDGGNEFLKSTAGVPSEAAQEATIRSSTGLQSAKTIIGKIRKQLAEDIPTKAPGSKKLDLSESQLKTLRRIEQQIIATKGTATPLEQRELARQAIEIQYGIDNVVEPSYSWADVDAQVTKYESDLQEQLKLMNDDLATEKRRAALAVEVGAATRPERSRTRRAKDIFGFGSSFSSAIKASNSNFYVRRFFSETVGGAPMSVGDSGFKRPWSISNVTTENRLAASMKTNTLSNSQAGRALQAGIERRFTMLALADPQLARVSAENIINGLGNGRTSSPVFFAESLEQQVQVLTNKLKENEKFRRLIANDEVLLEQLNQRLPYTEEQIAYLEELAFKFSEPIQTKAGLRVRPTTPAEIARLSEQEAIDLRELRQLRLVSARLKNDPQYAIAQQQKSRFAVLDVLAKIDGDRVVTMNGSPQWGTHSSYQTHVFGDSQFEPLTDDLLIERLLGGRGGRDVELMGQNVSKRPRDESVIAGIRKYGEVEWDFLPRGTSIHAVKMEQVDFVPGMTDADYVFVSADGLRIGAVEAQVAISSNQPITVLKPITLDGSLGGANRLQELSLRKGESFTPKETWLISPAGEYSMYQRNIAGGTLGGRGEGGAILTQCFA
jgi:hypothetical protein